MAEWTEKWCIGLRLNLIFRDSHYFLIYIKELRVRYQGDFLPLIFFVACPSTRPLSSYNAYVLPSPSVIHLRET